MMTEEQYVQLRDDIKEHGQCEDVVVWKGLLLDGRNRLRACEELGIEPQIAELMEETDPVAYVISHNLHRRHLTTTQRSDVAAKLATLKHGDVKSQKSELQKCNSTIADAATLLNVSKRSVSAASYVHDHGCKELKDGISSGEIPVTLAEKFSKEFTDKKEQAKIAKGGTKAIKEALKGGKTKEKIAATSPASAPVESQASIMLDSLGRQIPKNLRSASELAIQLQATGRELDKFRKLAKDFSEQPGGEWLRLQDISDGIKVLKDHFQLAAYHTACAKCGGKGCKVCEMTGWIPEYLRGTL